MMLGVVVLGVAAPWPPCCPHPSPLPPSGRGGGCCGWGGDEGWDGVDDFGGFDGGVGDAFDHGDDVGGGFWEWGESLV